MSSEELFPLIGSHTIWNPQDSKRLLLTCALICIAQGLERATFFALIASIKTLIAGYPLYILDKSGFEGSRAMLLFLGTTFLLCFVFGYISDAYIQRYKIILLGFGSLLTGVSYLVTLAYYVDGIQDMFIEIVPPERANSSQLSLYIPLCTTLSHSEVDCNIPIMVSLLLIVIGSSAVRTNLVVMGADQIRELAREGSTFKITNFVHIYGWSFMLGAWFGYAGSAYLSQAGQLFHAQLLTLLSTITGTVVFVVGLPFYIKTPSNTKIISIVFRVITTAVKNKFSRWKRGYPKLSFFDNAKPLSDTDDCCEPDEVDVVKNFGKACVLILMCVPTGCGYSELEYWFRKHNSKGEAKNELAWQFLGQYNLETVVLLTPIVLAVYHLLVKKSIQLHLWKIMAFGMILAVAALLIGGIMDLHFKNNYGTFWVLEIIPSVLYGLSQLFTYVIGIEYAYFVAPRASQGTAMGIFLSVMYGLGTILASVMMLNTDMLIVAGVLFISVIVFIVSAKHCKFAANVTLNAVHN